MHLFNLTTAPLPPLTQQPAAQCIHTPDTPHHSSSECQPTTNSHYTMTDLLQLLPRFVSCFIRRRRRHNCNAPQLIGIIAQPHHNEMTHLIVIDKWQLAILRSLFSPRHYLFVLRLPLNYLGISPL